MKRSEIIQFARTLVGVEFKHMGRGGRDGRRGYDCVGFMIALCDEFGVNTRDIIGTYSIYPTGGLIEKMFGKFLVEIDVDDVRPASVCLMYHTGHYARGQEPSQHAYIMSDPIRMKIIHANDFPGIEKVTENCMEKGWKDQVLHRYDFPGVEDG